MTDLEIIALYWKRNENAITQTKNKYHTYCFSIALRILDLYEDAEECTADTYLRVWNSIPPTKPSCFKSFLAKITRNLAFDKFRCKHSQKRGCEMTLVLDELENCIPSRTSVDDELLGKEMREYINRFLQTLPLRERNIFLRRYFFVEKTEEIAKHYALKESYVLVILSRTRQKLRNYLESEGMI